MLFPTFEFALFFFVVYILNWGLHKSKIPRKTLLIIASYFFYGFWDWRFTFLLFISSLANFLGGLTLGSLKSILGKRLVLALSLIFNLGLLGFFKYYTFFSLSVNNLLLKLGYSPLLPLMDIILPVGISFFTFQAMSYVIDVYRGRIPAAGSFLDILLYISFFPQLVAGPIVRASDFLPQLTDNPDPLRIQTTKAFTLIAGGLFKKVIIANYLSVLLVDKVFANPGAYSALDALFAVYAYAVQIFCDFSAYSDIAIGVAALLGYQFPVNFNAPYRAESIQDFWRRWHISLSTWLKDYLYIPLGGSKKGRLKTYGNLLITMLLGGLWHGAAWNFVFWGFLHGSALAVNRFLGRLFPGPGSNNRFLRFIKIVVTFHFVCLAWIFFRSSSFGLAFEYLGSFFHLGQPATLVSPFILLLIGLGLAIHFIPQRLKNRGVALFDLLPVPLQGAVLGSYALLLGALAPEGVAPFIYFQF